jgi:hypothetical protein
VTQEAEIRRIAVQSQTGKIICETLSLKHPSQKKKKAGRVAQSVGLSSTPSTTKKGGDIIVIQKKKVLLFFVQVILWSYRQY